MQFQIDNQVYDVVVIKKKSTKRLYIRVKDDLKIYVTTSRWTPNFEIRSILEKNYDKIVKMIENQKMINKNNDGFNYLGKKYEIVYVDEGTVRIDGDKVYIKRGYDIDNWYKKEAKVLFQTMLDENYEKFTRDIPRPTLTIRRMKSRWGVCNIKTHRITLNLKLIERDPKYLNYVIMHELSHLIHADHTRRFWSLVEENCPDYKTIAKEMKLF
jgi:predicted metal-dependent hydrolase